MSSNGIENYDNNDKSWSLSLQQKRWSLTKNMVVKH